MRAQFTLSAAVLVAACLADAGPQVEPMTLAPATGPVTLIREATGSDAGGADLFLPASPRVAGGRVWVLDGGNDRLVGFDATLSHALVVGREGEGPGEIQFAGEYVVDQGRLIVAEMGNSRLSVFDTSGAFRSVIPLARPPRFLAVVDTTLVVTTGVVGPEYVYRVGERGQVVPYATVPGSIRRLAASQPALYLPASPYIASGAGGELYVLDPSVLALTEFGQGGEVVGVHLLPEPIRAQLLERRLEQRKAWGAKAAAFVDTPASKRISVDPEGRILLLFSLPDSWGLLIDPRDWSARPLPLPENRRLHDLLWAASDATLHGDRLYVVTGSQLYEFAVEGWR